MSTKISIVEESTSNKICEVEKSIAFLKDSVSTIKESVANIKEQIKTEVEQIMKVQSCVWKQTVEQTVPMAVSYTHLDVYKRQILSQRIHEVKVKL